MWRGLIIGLIAAFATGCASSLGSKPVVYFERAHEGAQRVEYSSLPLFLDFNGDLYPSSGFGTPRPLHTGHTMALQDSAVRVYCHDGVFGEAQLYCDSSITHTARQSQLWSNRVDQFNQLLSEADSPVMVVLIHGFNVPNAKLEYRAWKHVISQSLRPDETAVFLEVNWNGFVSGTIEKGWGEAQFSGPISGFTLREFFNRLIQEQGGAASMPPVRVFTHSSGAYVAGATFGNPYNALPCLHNPRHYCGTGYARFMTHRASQTPGDLYRIPEITDLRLGMIAAATSPDTFLQDTECEGRRRWWQRSRTCTDISNSRAGFGVGNAAITLSLNRNDYGLRKGVLPVRLARMWGSSSLGTDAEQACRLVQARTPPEVIALNFTSQHRFADTSSHSLSSYLRHDNAEAFIANVLYGTPVPSADALITCPPPDD